MVGKKAAVQGRHDSSDDTQQSSNYGIKCSLHHLSKHCLNFMHPESSKMTQKSSPLFLAFLLAPSSVPMIGSCEGQKYQAFRFVQVQGNPSSHKQECTWEICRHDIQNHISWAFQMAPSCWFCVYKHIYFK